MEFKDYYATLGVAKTATEKEIKQAFRKLARKHHPDVNPGDKAAEARSRRSTRPTRCSAIRRSARSTTSSAPTGARTSRPARGGADPFGGWNVEHRRRRRRLPHDDAGRDAARCSATRRSVLRLLPDVLRRRRAARTRRRTPGGPRHGRARQGRDVEHEIELTLEDAYHGAMRRLSIKHDGHARTVDVRIPAGVGDGSRVRVAGEGEHGSRRRRSRAICICASGSRRTRSFERKGTDLYAQGRRPADDRGARRRSGSADARRQAAAAEGAADDAERPGVPAEGTRHAGRSASRDGTRRSLRDASTSQLPTSLTPEQREHFEALGEAGRRRHEDDSAA